MIVESAYLNIPQDDVYSIYMSHPESWGGFYIRSASESEPPIPRISSVGYPMGQEARKIALKKGLQKIQVLVQPGRTSLSYFFMSV
jgi:hypothetical protein